MIKTSDIIKNDGAIKEVVDQMERLNNMFDKIVKNAQSLKDATTKLNASQKSNQQSITKNADEAQKLHKQYSEVSKQLGDNAVKYQQLKEQQKQLEKVNKLEAKTMATKFNSYDNLNAQLQLARTRYNQMTEAEKESTREGQKLTSQLSRLTAKVNTLKREQREATKIRELENKVVREQQGSYNQLSAQYSLMKIRLNKMSAEQRANTKIGRDMERQSKAIYEEMKRLQEVTGKNTLNVGNYADALENLGGPIGLVITQSRQLGRVWTKLSKNPFILTLTALVGTFSGLAASLNRTSIGQDAVNKRLAQGKSLFDNLLDVVTLTGQAVFGVGANFDDVRNKLSGFSAEVASDVQRAGKLAEVRAKLNREENDALVENSRLQKESADARAQAEQLKFRDAQRSIELLKQSFDLEEQILAEELRLSKIRLAARQEESALANDDIAAEREVAEARAEVEQKEAAFNEKRIARFRKLNTFQKEQASQLKKIADLRISNLRLEAEEEIELNQAKIKSTETTQDEGLRLISENDEKRIQLITEGERAELELLERFNELKIITEQEYELRRQNILKEANAERREAYELAQSEVLELRERFAQQDGQADDSIFSFLGIKLTDDELQGFKSGIDFIKTQLTEVAALQTELAQQRVDDIADEISSIENRLQREIDARNAGYANSVESVQRELNLQKEAQREAIEERRKAQRAEQAIQTLEQGVNLTTAAAKINAQVGFPASIPIVALMFGAFAAARIKAAQLAKEEFSEGGLEFIGGGSHASGNDTPLGFMKNGKHAYGENGESHMILKPDATRRYKHTLPRLYEDLRTGKFDPNYMDRSFDVSPTYVTSSTQVDMSKAESELKTIREQGERKWNGNIMVYKNLTRRYIN